MIGVPTEKQLAILLFIIEFRARHGYSPAWTDIGARFGLRRTGEAVSCHIRALKKKGLLSQDGRAARSLVPLVRFIPADQLANASGHAADLS